MKTILIIMCCIINLSGCGTLTNERITEIVDAIGTYTASK